MYNILLQQAVTKGTHEEGYLFFELSPYLNPLTYAIRNFQFEIESLLVEFENLQRK